MNTGSGTVVLRLARRLFVWRNPLAGPGDRLESAVAIVSVAVAVLGLPVAAAVGSEVCAQGAVTSSEQMRTRHQVDAVLFEGTPPPAGDTGYAMLVTESDVPATWVLPDGKARSGEVRATGGVPAGGKVRIWIDDGGSPVDAPLTAGGAVVIATMVAMGLWLILGTAMALLYGAVRWAHIKARRRRWESEWAAVEPGWRKLA